MRNILSISVNMNAEIQIKLRQFYKNDIEQLEDMIKIDLSQLKGD